MANVAAVFHWPLSELQAMSPQELGRWNRRALEVAGTRDKDDG